MQDVSAFQMVFYGLLGLVAGSFVLYAAVYFATKAYFQAKLRYHYEYMQMQLSFCKHELFNQVKEYCDGKAG